MAWIIENWSVIFGMLAVLITLIVAIIAFIKLGKDKQIEKIKEWLLYACTVAEKELGNGTGQLKLRYVYDMFVEKFTFMKLIISFEEFSKLVDGSLETMKELLKNNKQINKYVKGISK